MEYSFGKGAVEQDVVEVAAVATLVTDVMPCPCAKSPHAEEMVFALCAWKSPAVPPTSCGAVTPLVGSGFFNGGSHGTSCHAWLG